MNKSKTVQRVTLERLISQKLENSKLLSNFLEELPGDTNLDDITISLKYSPREKRVEEWRNTPDGATRQVIDTSTSESRKKSDSRLSGKRLIREVDKQGRRILYVER